MGPKVLLLLLPVFLVAGCSGAKRFLPPGFVKYEDIAKDQPVHPDIEEAIAETRAEEPKGYPLVSDQPSERPEAEDPIVRAVRLGDISEKRDTLNAAVEEDRRAARVERGLPAEPEDVEAVAPAE